MTSLQICKDGFSTFSKTKCKYLKVHRINTAWALLLFGDPDWLLLTYSTMHRVPVRGTGKTYPLGTGYLRTKICPYMPKYMALYAGNATARERLRPSERIPGSRRLAAGLACVDAAGSLSGARRGKRGLRLVEFGDSWMRAEGVKVDGLWETGIREQGRESVRGEGESKLCWPGLGSLEDSSAVSEVFALSVRTREHIPRSHVNSWRMS